MVKWTCELNRTFSKEEIQMARKHMKKCSPSLAIKEMQINFLFLTENTPQFSPSCSKITLSSLLKTKKNLLGTGGSHL
jgi:hypothetical protein